MLRALIVALWRWVNASRLNRALALAIVYYLLRKLRRSTYRYVGLDVLGSFYPPERLWVFNFYAMIVQSYKCEAIRPCWSWPTSPHVWWVVCVVFAHHYFESAQTAFRLYICIHTRYHFVCLLLTLVFCLPSLQHQKLPSSGVSFAKARSHHSTLLTSALSNWPVWSLTSMLLLARALCKLERKPSMLMKLSARRGRMAHFQSLHPSTVCHVPSRSVLKLSGSHTRQEW